jgi:hypothetical protein
VDDDEVGQRLRQQRRRPLDDKLLRTGANLTALGKEKLVIGTWGDVRDDGEGVDVEGQVEPGAVEV